MARGPLHRGSLRPKEEQLAARAAAVATFLEMLKEGLKTAADLFAVVGGKRPTVSNYLAHMHKNMRVIRMTGQYRDRAELWTLGADPALPAPDDELDHIFAVKRGIGPARQIGMRRDPLVAALFGQPLGAAA